VKCLGCGKEIEGGICRRIRGLSWDGLSEETYYLHDSLECFGKAGVCYFCGRFYVGEEASEIYAPPGICYDCWEEAKLEIPCPDDDCELIEDFEDSEVVV